MKIRFSEEKHLYWDEESPKKENLKSISWVISKLKQPFDREGLSKKAALKEGVTQEEILKRWDDKKDKACAKGTRLHAIKEGICIKEGENVNAPIWDGQIKTAYDLKSLKAGTYPELILYNPQFKLCGTADGVEINDKKEFWIYDWKTNSSIEFESFKVFDPISKQRYPKMMLTPISHLMDCNGIHYTIQMSCYAYMLEQYGFKCKGLKLIHLILDDNEEIVQEIPYEVPYLKKEVHSIFNYLKSKKLI